MGNILKLFHSIRNAGNAGKNCCAIIVAAGSGQRMNASVNKQFLEINDKPVLAYTLEAFEQCQEVDEIIIVAKEDEILMVGDLVCEYEIGKVKNIVKGGDTRQQSVYNGLMAAGGYTHVAVHDGARPFILPATIKKTIMAAFAFGSAAVGVPVNDTIKECDSKGIITKTVDRSQLWAVQTPQVFLRELLIGGHEYIKNNNIAVTDDCMVIEALGGGVKMVRGEYTNIKITTPSDLAYGEAIVLEEREMK